MRPALDHGKGRHVRRAAPSGGAVGVFRGYFRRGTRPRLGRTPPAHLGALPRLPRSYTRAQAAGLLAFGLLFLGYLFWSYM